MSWDELTQKYKLERIEYDRLYKCLHATINRKVSKETFDSNLHSFVDKYNAILHIFIEGHSNLTKEQGYKVKETYSSLRDKTLKLFTQLKLHIVVPIDFKDIDLHTLEDVSDTESENMALSKEDFYALATKGIKNYAGNPLSLQAFLNSLKLMQEMAGDTHAALLISIVMTKLEGNAQDAVDPNSKTLDEIINALKGDIKPESSKVLEARLAALRFDRTKVQEFCKESEELAENLKRSLVIEGVTASKATEMVIDKTVEMCRACTRSDLVKAVLSATKYDNHKEVVAKLVLESSTEVKEKQVLAYKARGRFDKRNRGNGRGGQYNNRQGQYRGGQNGGYRGNNQRGNNRQFTNSNRGRGRGRGYYGNNQHSVRVIEASENSEVPQHFQLGDSQTMMPYRQ